MLAVNRHCECADVFDLEHRAGIIRSARLGRSQQVAVGVGDQPEGSEIGIYGIATDAEYG